MKRLHILFLLALLLPTISIHSQEEEAEKDNSLKGQFEELERISGNYRANGIRYEVIKLSDLYQVKNNILDSLATYGKTIKDLSATIDSNEAEIDGLNSKLQETTNNLNSVTEEKDSISFFGASIGKGTYNFILWSIIFGLLLLLLFFIYRFRNSNALTQQAKSALDELEEEYETHR